MVVAGYWAESGRAGSVALIRNRRWVFAWTAGLLLLAAASGTCKAANTNGVTTYPLNNNPQVREAYQHLYVLDYDGAVTRFEQIAAAHPNDAMAEAYLLNAVVMRELYRLDLLDTTFYANDGFLTGKHPVPEDPRARDHIFSLCDTVVGLSEQELKANNKDVNALYARGWARSLKAAYMAMVERSFSAALHLALQARTDNEKVLDIDPNYVDAKMVVGIYQYVIGALPFAFKIMVGFAGIHGSKSEGMKLLQDSASRGVLTKVESKTVIALFLRREGKYQEAIVVIRGFKERVSAGFPVLPGRSKSAEGCGRRPGVDCDIQEPGGRGAKAGIFPVGTPRPGVFWIGGVVPRAERICGICCGLYAGGVGSGGRGGAETACAGGCRTDVRSFT